MRDTPTGVLREDAEGGRGGVDGGPEHPAGRPGPHLRPPRYCISSSLSSLESDDTEFSEPQIRALLGMPRVD